MYTRYRLFLEAKVQDISNTIVRKVDYENGFTLTYKIVDNIYIPNIMKDFRNYDSRSNELQIKGEFEKDGKRFFYIKDLTTFQKVNIYGSGFEDILLDNNNIMQSEKEVLEFKYFENLYHFDIQKRTIQDCNLKFITRYISLTIYKDYKIKDLKKLYDTLKENPFVQKINFHLSEEEGEDEDCINVIIFFPQDIYDQIYDKIEPTYPISHKIYNKILEYLLQHSKKYNLLY